MVPLPRVFSEGTYCSKDCHVHSFQNVVTEEGDDVSNKVTRTRGLVLPWKKRLGVFVLGPTAVSKLNWGSRRLTAVRKLADAVDLPVVEFIKAPLVWQEELTRMEVPGKALVASEGVEVKEGSEGGTRTTAVEATKIETRREGSVDEIRVGPGGVPSCRSAFGIS